MSSPIVLCMAFCTLFFSIFMHNYYNVKTIGWSWCVGCGEGKGRARVTNVVIELCVFDHNFLVPKPVWSGSGAISPIFFS